MRKAELYDAFARIGKALASGKRLELVDLLAQGERSVDALAKAAGLNLTTASAHLQILRHAGLVTSRREGVRIYYRPAGRDVLALFSLLRKVGQAHLADVEAARVGYLDHAGAEDGPPTTKSVGREGLLARMAADAAIVLDVRPLEEYVAGHIPGALSIPVDQLAERLDELPDDAEVVVYCRGEYCVLAYDAVRLLHSRGRTAVRLREGMLEWRLAELPVATEAPGAPDRKPIGGRPRTGE
jgi:rhodanese-related sulfurtransferase/DNA-binding transcriptional ArsR family regulator